MRTVLESRVRGWVTPSQLAAVFAASVWLLARARLPCLCLIRLSHLDKRENNAPLPLLICRAGGVLLIGFSSPISKLPVGFSPQQLSCQS